MMQLILLKFIDELDKCVPWMSYHQIGVYSYCYKGEGQPMVVFRTPTFGGGKVPQRKETTIHFKWRYIKQYASCMSKFGLL